MSYYQFKIYPMNLQLSDQLQKHVQNPASCPKNPNIERYRVQIVEHGLVGR